MGILSTAASRCFEGRADIPVWWLGQPECGERPRVGGKAANLSRLAEDFRVPPGFSLIPGDEPAAEGMPPTLAAELAGAYEQLGERLGAADPPVAVRSSAVDEDSESASFAGQHETFLNVSGIEAVEEAVLGCWASARTDRAVEYRRAHGLPPAADWLPVLVQALVVADAAAVVFSANPVTGDRGEIVINASWGLGESVVAGSVTPDTHVLRRTDLGADSREIATKVRMTVAVPGGTREFDVPWALRNQPAVSDAQAREMAELALTLEDRFGWPVDIECCWAAGELYLLQCRAITTGEPASEAAAAGVPATAPATGDDGR